jgi:hypothetical protein
MDGYGPAVLATLEYVAHLLGIDYAAGRFTLSSGAREEDSTYTQHLFDKTYTLTRTAGRATLTVDGAEVLSFTGGVRIVTDEEMRILSVHGMEPTAQKVALTVDGIAMTATVHPNEAYAVRDGRLVRTAAIPFSCPVTE